jgi:hypothetical protein
MKKILFAILLLVVSGITMLACSINDGANLETNQLEVADFNRLGEVHNLFLTNVKENFSVIESITDEQERIESIYRFNKDFVSSLDISSTEKSIMIDNLEKTKSFVKEDVLLSQSFGDTTYRETGKNKKSDENLFEIIDNLKISGIINENSHQILNSLTNDLKDNYEGFLTDEQLKTNVQSYINDFNEIGYTKNSEGEMVGAVLAISISSIEWWEENPDALGNLLTKNKAPSNALVAPWIATDLVGAALGAASSTAIQYGVTGEVNGEIVAWSAVATGVAASTGAIGKIAQWFTS